MDDEFEWDRSKATSNETKHSVSFDEASTVFHDDFSITIVDPEHSDDEDRLIQISFSRAGRLLVVVFTDRNGHVRIISAREATKVERKTYER